MPPERDGPHAEHCGSWESHVAVHALCQQGLPVCARLAAAGGSRAQRGQRMALGPAHPLNGDAPAKPRRRGGSAH